MGLALAGAQRCAGDMVSPARRWCFHWVLVMEDHASRPVCLHDVFAQLLTYLLTTSSIEVYTLVLSILPGTACCIPKVQCRNGHAMR